MFELTNAPSTCPALLLKAPMYNELPVASGLDIVAPNGNKILKLYNADAGGFDNDILNMLSEPTESVPAIKSFVSAVSVPTIAFIYLEVAVILFTNPPSEVTRLELTLLLFSLVGESLLQD